MILPVINGLIERRILVNYRVDPEVIGRLLPPPFRPKIVRGLGMTGLCLLRLAKVRPAFLPAWMGVASENVAHRTAVEWEENGEVREGVFIRRRDTSSTVQWLLGGRVFPGLHHRARFAVRETEDRYRIDIRSDDGGVQVAVRARRAENLPCSSVFHSLDEASAFFLAGAVGYSAGSRPSHYQGLALKCRNWKIEPLDLEEVRSNFFDDTSLFPEGSLELDCGLLMRGIDHQWHGQADLCCTVGDRCEAPQSVLCEPAGEAQ